MPDKLNGAESTTRATERRASQRVRPSSLLYVQLDNETGGIVTSISEGGLALMAAGTLTGREKGDALGKMQIQLPESWGTIEANGRVAWKSKSGKEAGVRLVDLEEEARDRIQKWISAQTRKSNAEVGQPELPKLQLPKARTPKKRGSRFSFADVASSRVGAEEEAHAGHFPGVGQQPEASPPIESETFVDSSKGVASAFETTAFTEEHKAEALPDRGAARTVSPAEEARQARPPSSFPERRSYSRRPILLFTYAALGDDNGGLVFNLGEGGLALTAAAGLRDSYFSRMRVRFPESQDEIETKGRLAWISDSGKEAGIEFVGLAEDVRARIREWVSLGEPEDDSRREEREVQKNQDQPSGLASFAEPEGAVSVPRESRASFEERLNTPVASRSPLFPSGMTGDLARATVRRRVAEIKLPEPPRLRRHAVEPQDGVSRRALVAAALLLLGLGWILLQRNYLKEAGGLVAQNAPKPAIAGEPKEKIQDGATKSTADPRIAQPLDATPQARTLESGARSLETITDPGVKQGVQNQDPVNLARNPAVNSTQRATYRREQKTTPPREQKPEPRRGLAPAPFRSEENRLVEDKPLENKPAQTAQVLPAPNREVNAAPPSLSATPMQSEAASTFGKEREALLVAPKQPEVPVARTPIVSVSFDPYPSIRMPEKENSKKSRQGKSLQMGHLVLRIDPAYPEEAKQQGVEGAVKIHVVLSREGAVKSLTSMSGPPLLARAAMNAVRQCRFSPTLLAGQAMETEEDVTVLFRLSSVPSKN
jgi:TonB family protein